MALKWALSEKVWKHTLLGGKLLSKIELLALRLCCSILGEITHGDFQGAG